MHRLPFLDAESWIEPGKLCFESDAVKHRRELFNSIDPGKAWDDPVNVRAARTIMPAILLPQNGKWHDDTGSAVTHFVFVTGGPDGFVGASPGEDRVTIEDIRGRTVVTLAFGQIHTGLGPWITEGPYSARQFIPATETLPGTFGSGFHKNGWYFALCDSFTFLVEFNETTNTCLRQAATRAEREIIDFKKYKRVANPFDALPNQ